jgi:putative transposase
VMNALETPFVKKLKNNPYNYLNNLDEEFIEKHKKKRDKAWFIIKELVEAEPYIYSADQRGELIKEVTQKQSVQKKFIYKKLKQYWVGGKIKNALLPHYNNSGGKGKNRSLNNKKVGRPSNKFKENPELVGVNVTEGDKKIFKTAIRLFYENSNSPELKFTYRQMIKKFYHLGYHMTKNDVLVPILPNPEETPTYRQFCYWYNKEFNSKERFLQKEGGRKYNLKIKPNVGEASKRTTGPGAVFEIDATIADVYLVSSLASNRIIGRPVVYIVKDVFSRVVTGVYVGLEGPSWLGAMLALENACSNKSEYCLTLALTISEDEWPSHHLPQSIVADRGEMEGYNADRLTDYLGVQILNTPPYRADLKGIVEQHFRSINTKVKNWIPGAVHKDYRERGGNDYRLDAKLTLKAFEKIIVLSILEHNQKIISNYSLTEEMVKNKISPIPNELWDWGMKNKQGYLKEIDRDLIRMVLMPQAQASITREGIYYRKRYYSSDFAKENGWFEEAVVRGRRKITITYDPRSINFIYIKNQDGVFIKFNLLNQETSDIKVETRVEDYEEFIYAKSIEEDIEEGSQLQKSSDRDAEIASIIAEETIMTNHSKIPGQSKLSRTKEIKQNRRDEKELNRKNQNWDDTLKHKSIIHEELMSKDHNLTNISETFDESGSILSMLKGQSEKRRISNE